MACGTWIFWFYSNKVFKMKDLTVREALSVFYKENQFDSDGGVSKTISWAKFWFFKIPIINLKARKIALQYHDLHHIITRYPTSIKGEAEISAWELASGGWGRLWYIWGFVLTGMGIGVILYPTATRKAFYGGVGSTNVYMLNRPFNQLLDLTLPEIRQAMSKQKSQSRPYWFWATLSACTILVPAIIFLGLMAWLFQQ
jgi:hypothetical protein